MTDLMREAMDGLIPPDARPKTPRARYDAAISITLAGVIVVGGLHIAQACGLLAWLGLSGFAMAKDVQEQGSVLVQLQVGQINRDIRDAKREICRAQDQGNAAALESWSGQLQTYRGQYYAITKSWPQVQSCEELLVTVRSASATAPAGTP